MEAAKDLVHGYKAIVEKALAIFVDRQKKYGPSNIKVFGELGVLIRANDKIERLKNSHGKDFVDESIDDTWIDIINYGIIAMMLRKNYWGLPLVDTQLELSEQPANEVSHLEKRVVTLLHAYGEYKKSRGLNGSPSKVAELNLFALLDSLHEAMNG